MLVRGAYSAFQVLRSVLNRVRHVLLLLVGSVLSAALLFSIAEGKALWDGLWWAVVTGWTVGYGDLYPVTAFGRAVGIVHIVWMSLLWLIVGAHVIAAVLVDKNAFTSDEQETVKATLLEIGQRLGVIEEDRTDLPSAREWAKNGHYNLEEESEERAFDIIGEEPDK